MKESLLMKVLFCEKTRCPFFCKSSAAVAAHIYTSRDPLKLENTQNDLVVTSIPISDDLSDNSSTEFKHEIANGNQEETGNLIKSCVRKIHSVNDARNDVAGKKRVKWIDEFGEELAEIKEFESSETGDTYSDEESSCCFCVIL